MRGILFISLLAAMPVGAAPAEIDSYILKVLNENHFDLVEYWALHLNRAKAYRELMETRKAGRMQVSDEKINTFMDLGTRINELRDQLRESRAGDLSHRLEVALISASIRQYREQAKGILEFYHDDFIDRIPPPEPRMNLLNYQAEVLTDNIKTLRSAIYLSAQDAEGQAEFTERVDKLKSDFNALVLESFNGYRYGILSKEHRSILTAADFFDLYFFEFKFDRTSAASRIHTVRAVRKSWPFSWATDQFQIRKLISRIENAYEEKALTLAIIFKIPLQTFPQVMPIRSGRQFDYLFEVIKSSALQGYFTMHWSDMDIIYYHSLGDIPDHKPNGGQRCDDLVDGD